MQGNSMDIRIANERLDNISVGSCQIPFKRFPGYTTWEPERVEDQERNKIGYLCYLLD